MMRKLAALLLLLMLAIASAAYYAYSPVTPATLPMEFTVNQFLYIVRQLMTCMWPDEIF